MANLLGLTPSISYCRLMSMIAKKDFRMEAKMKLKSTANLAVGLMQLLGIALFIIEL
jgi:hypothetical protein